MYSHISSSEVYRMFTVFRSELLLFLVKVGKKDKKYGEMIFNMNSSKAINKEIYLFSRLIYL